MTSLGINSITSALEALVPSLRLGLNLVLQY